MSTPNSARGAYLYNKIITREYSDLEGAVLYRSYRTPDLELPPSAVELEPITNLFIPNELDSESLITPKVLSDCILNISNTNEYSFNTFSFNDLGIEIFENVEFSISHDENQDPLSLEFYYVDSMKNITFQGICGGLIFGNGFRSKPFISEDVSFQGLELESEIRFFNCYLRHIDFLGLKRLHPEEGFSIYLDSCGIWECDFGNLLSSNAVAFVSCVVFNKDVFTEISKYKKQRPMYFGEGAHSEIDCASPQLVNFVRGEPCNLNVKNAHFEHQNTLLMLPETTISDSDFTDSILGSSLQNHTFGFCFMPDEGMHTAWNIPLTLDFINDLRSQKISLFENSNFSNAKLLSVVIYIVNPNADYKTFPEFMADLVMFAHCDFSNALLGSIKLSPEYSSQTYKFFDYTEELKADLRKELFEGARIPLSFKNCTFDGCVSYIHDLREHGGIFFGKDSYTENVDLEGRELLAYFGENSSYRNVDFSNCEFLNVGTYPIKGCTFIECDFSNSNASVSIFQHCIFKNCDFRDVDIAHAMFQSCEFIDCIVPKGYTFETSGKIISMERETP